MSKLSASEFQTWESLYWPDRIPRTSKMLESMPSAALPSPSAAWHYESGTYSVSWEELGEAVDKVTKSLTSQEKVSPVAVVGSDALLVLAGVAASFKSGMSIEIVEDSSKTSSSCALEINQARSTGNPVADFEVKPVGDHGSGWEPAEPCVSLLFPEGVRVIYPQRELLSAIESFLAFTEFRAESGVAVLGSLCREFGFFAALSALFSGVPLVVLKDIGDFQQHSPTGTSALFVGRDVGVFQESPIESYGTALAPLRRSFSFLGVEGPASSEFSRSLEKSTRIPVLQMYGISGRGILFSNPKEFNVHGSMGIPITNVEAIIADNYEGNWTRDRILIGPGIEGELVVRGAFIDRVKDVGDPRQNPVKTGIRGQSTDWVTTGIMGKMDENGYFYSKDASFR